METNLNYLVSFLELARTLNFSKAAKNLQMAQPGLSRQIKQLEESIGVSLFRRDNKRVVLTAEGESFYNNISSAMNDITESIQSIRDHADNKSGRIIVGCPLEFGELVMAPLCSKFNQEYPDIQLSLKFCAMNEVPKLLLEGKVDFGVGLKPLDQDNIRSYKFIEQNSYLLSANKNQKFDLKVEEMEFAGYSENDPLIGNFVKKHIAKTSKFKYKLKFMANSHSALVGYLENNPGVYGVLPFLSRPVIEAMERKSLYQVGSKTLLSSLFLLTSVEDTMPARKKLFKTFLLKEIESFKKTK
ncbi:transcriptional regulator, LysR family [Bacteriovorax sp. BSW11_IV]|uniref:LysR family transcriptional regulator n=1 Tax=Bacteriovorax sp. BSW11_IV TaxID=1353529 RepID=UPI00038A4D15|nr:LysR family transcriptional regulator [Bacteriovorax sp. BSW11_IV]EQC49954.1 transcriptional regulator, LysR family [Bacteriovorax sp. BSW11_IV]